MGLQEILGVPEEYVHYCREERNFAAVLYGLLMDRKRLEKFLHMLQVISEPDLEALRGAKVYFEYAALRDMWAEAGARHGSVDERNAVYRRAIISMLGPLGESLVLPEEPKAFNQFFIGTKERAVSETQIQMPSRWNGQQFGPWRDALGGNEELAERICKIKFAFNAKPDLVIHLGNGAVICIEAKLKSGAGSYGIRSGDALNAKYASVNQLQLQEFIFKDLLQRGNTHFFLLSGSGNAPLRTGWRGITWKMAFDSVGTDPGETAVVQGFRESKFIRKA